MSSRATTGFVSNRVTNFRGTPINNYVEKTGLSDGTINKIILPSVLPTSNNLDDCNGGLKGGSILTVETEIDGDSHKINL